MFLNLLLYIIIIYIILLIIDFSRNPDEDEPYAWEAREFLRKKLIGQYVLFTTPKEKAANQTRDYGTLFFDPPSKFNFVVKYFSKPFCLRLCIDSVVFQTGPEKILMNYW